MTRNAQPITIVALARQLEALRRRALTPQAGKQDLALFAEAITELGTALEELQVADEELRQQADELQAAHSEADVERQRYQELFDLAPDAYLVTDGYGKIKETNVAACHLFNLDRATLVSKPMAAYVSQVDKAAFYNLILEARRTNEQQTGEVCVRPRGYPRRAQVDAEFTVVIAQQTHTNGSGITLRWLIRDITHRKQADAKMHQAREQMKMFASSVEAAREEERTRISREIHDELGQTLTGLKMDLDWLRAKLPDEPEMRERFGTMTAVVNGSIQSMRRIMTDLRPAMLDDLGLVATIEWQCSDFQSRTGVRCRFRSNVDEVCIGKDRASTVFRLVQEILTNVARHASARQVHFTLKQTKRWLRLEARDDGRGITDEQINNTHSSGLLGMRERVHLLGGQIEWKGTPDKGTTVRIQVPCEASTPVVKARSRNSHSRTNDAKLRGS